MSDQPTRGKETARRIHGLVPGKTDSHVALASAALMVMGPEPMLSPSSADPLFENLGNAPASSFAPPKTPKRGIKAILSRTKPQTMDQSSRISSTANASTREYQDLSGAITAPPSNDLRSTRIDVSEQKDAVDLEMLKVFLDLGSKVTGIAGDLSNAIPGVLTTVTTSLQLVSDFLTALRVGHIDLYIDNRAALLTLYT
jgi:hypothetical protein